MLELKYIGESISYPISFKNISDTICQITGDFPAKTGGFTLSRMGKDDAWDYSGYSTVYRQIDGGMQFSNDGSVFVPQITFSADTGGTLNGESTQEAHNYEDLEIPTPEPAENYVFSGWKPEIPASGEISDDQRFRAVFEYISPLNEVQENKVAEMNAAMESAIAYGAEVQLSDGTTERFTLTDRDQISLIGLQVSAAVLPDAQDIDPAAFPWHPADETVHCKFYSQEDMQKISTAGFQYVLYHVTYFRDLRIYIRSLTDKEAVQAITYGTAIPEAYQSEPLKQMLAAQAV